METSARRRYVGVILFLHDMRLSYSSLLWLHKLKFTFGAELALSVVCIVLFIACQRDYFCWRFAEETTEFPPSLTVPLTLKSKLRYGENPHQRAAVYEDKSLCEFGAGGIVTAVQYHGQVSTLGLL